MDLALAPKAKVFQEDGQYWVTSRDVAIDFKKSHGDVRRDIRKLECSSEFRRCNFAESSYINSQNKTQPMWKITRDGFTFLAMGYTGSRAAKFKEKYIELFNYYENSYNNKDMWLKRIIVIQEEWSKFNKAADKKVKGLEQTVYNNHEPRIHECESGIKDCKSKIFKLEIKNRKRKYCSAKDRKILVEFQECPVKYGGYDNLCPICGADLSQGCEYDHATQVDKADKYNGWLICKLCNRRLGMPGGISRHDISPAYAEFRRRFSIWEKGPMRDPLFRNMKIKKNS